MQPVWPLFKSSTRASGPPRSPPGNPPAAPAAHPPPPRRAGRPGRPEDDAHEEGGEGEDSDQPAVGHNAVIVSSGPRLLPSRPPWTFVLLARHLARGAQSPMRAAIRLSRRPTWSSLA